MSLSSYREVLQVGYQFLGGVPVREAQAQTLFGCNTNLTSDYGDITEDVRICGVSRDNGI